MDVPSWIQAGVTVISLAVGAIGGYYSMASRVSAVEERVSEIPQSVAEIKLMIKNMDEDLDRANTTLAVVVAKQEMAEKERGH